MPPIWGRFYWIDQEYSDIVFLIMSSGISVEFLQFLKSIPIFTPREIFQKIQGMGYIGQERACKAVCLMAFRHLNRIRKIFLDGVQRNLLPPKENMLLLGPTGCGKTFLVELLFREVLKIPAVIIDITSYSETGYIGQDVNQLLTKLVYAADGDLYKASIGIVCIDEFDKISSGKNTAVFAGQGTTKDVTGLGVQRELLKMLEQAEIDIPVELSHSGYAPRVSFNTRDVPFLACGAFSGFRQVLNYFTSDENIGFTRSRTDTGISTPLNREEVEKAANFEAYGILPELIGRFARIIPFTPLSKEELTAILEQNTVNRYRHELTLDKIQLHIESAVYKFIVDKCIKRETGARGLDTFLTEYLEDACFDAYSTKKKDLKMTIFLADKKIQWDIN